MKGNKGITLIALVITIIVLLILAGVSIAMLSGDNSIFKKANQASRETSISTAKEAMMLAFNEAVTDDYYQTYYQHQASTMASTIDTKMSAAATAASKDGVTVTYTPLSDTSANKGKVTIHYNADSDTSKDVTGTVAASTATDATGLYNFNWAAPAANP